MDGRGSNKEILERQAMLNRGKNMPITREEKKNIKSSSSVLASSIHPREVL
jgi:hypothetical protein